MTQIADSTTDNLFNTIHVEPRFQNMDLSYYFEIESFRPRFRNNNDFDFRPVHIIGICRIFHIFCIRRRQPLVARNHNVLRRAKRRNGVGRAFEKAFMATRE